MARLYDAAWYVVFAALFAILFLEPTAFDNYLYWNGFTIFSIEFFTIHSTMLIFFVGYVTSAAGDYLKTRAGKNADALAAIPAALKYIAWAGLFLFYSVFIGVIAFFSGSALVFVYFWASTALKVRGFSGETSSEKGFTIAMWNITTLVFLASAFTSMFLLPIALWTAHLAGFTPDIPYSRLKDLAGDTRNITSSGDPSWICINLAIYFTSLALIEVYRTQLEKIVKYILSKTKAIKLNSQPFPPGTTLP